MRKRLWLVLVMLGLALVGNRALGQNAPEEQPDLDGSKALADRFALSAQQNLLASDLSPAVWRQSAALMDAACRLDSKNTRFARLLADYYLQLNDLPLAINAIKAYRALDPEDEVAQAQQIDLYLSQMQAADQKLGYCHDLEANEQIPLQVRSHAAYRCATYLLEQSSNAEAIKELDNSIKLSQQLNMEALRLKWDLTATDATTAQRVALLLLMMRSNPNDPLIAARLAEQTASVGLVSDSLTWFGVSDLLYSKQGGARDGTYARGYAAELALGGNTESAGKLLSSYLAVAPYDAEAWFMALSVQSNAVTTNNDKASQDAYDKLIQQAGVALRNNLQGIRKVIGVKEATTRPADSTEAVTIPDLSGDYELLQKSASASLIDAYINAGTDLAWYEIYYKHDSAAAGAILPTLTKLLGDGDVVLTRLAGWKDILDKNDDAAMAKLSSVQDADPYAALGVFEIKEKDKTEGQHDKNIELAKSILAKNPGGGLGLILWESLRSTGLNVQASDSTAAVKQELNSASNILDFLRIIQEPGSFYSIRAEPLKAIYQFAEPVLVRVSVMNIGKYDLTLSGDGAIHPDIWLDAQLKGDSDVAISGAAFDRLGGRIVLGRGDSVSTVVRVDGGIVMQLFTSNPNKTLMVQMKVTTNPLTIPPKDAKDRPTAVSGASGYQMELTHMFERLAMQIATADSRKALVEAAQSNDAGQRILALNTMAVTIGGASAEDRQQPETKAALEVFVKALHAALTDPDLPVQTFAKYFTLLSVPDSEKGKAYEMLAESKEWTDHIMALLLSSKVNNGLDVAKRMAIDADPTVSAMARATAAILIAHPTTRPTTGPSTMPDLSGLVTPASPAPASPAPDSAPPLTITPIMPAK